jgi:hypothetical protein
MRPMIVEVLDVLTDDCQCVPLVEDQDLVEALLAQATTPVGSQNSSTIVEQGKVVTFPAIPGE